MTVDPARFCDTLVAHGVSFFAGVPDSLLAPFCASLELRFPRGWLGKHPLTREDLEEEAGLVRAAGLKLDVH